MQIAMFFLTAIAGQTSGNLEVNDVLVTLIHDVNVPARESGILVKLAVKEGDAVQRGAKLGQIDTTLAEIDCELARIDAAVAEMEISNDVELRLAKKSKEVAETELAKSLDANRIIEKTVSATEVRRQRLVVEQSTLGIEQAQHDISVARLSRDYKSFQVKATEQHLVQRTIVSPLSGVVVEHFLQQGEWVKPGDSVLRIVALDQLRVEAFVDGNRFGGELKGRRASLSVTLPGDRRQTFAGRVTFVSPELDPVNGRVRIWAEVANDSRLQLRPGARGRLTVEVPTNSR